MVTIRYSVDFDDPDELEAFVCFTEQFWCTRRNERRPVSYLSLVDAPRRAEVVAFPVRRA